MCHKELLSLLRQDKLIAICRGAEGESLLSLAAAIRDGGIRFIEVTFQQERDDCADLARRNIKALCGMPGIIPGAGTVLSPDQVRAAYEAGAKIYRLPKYRPRRHRKLSAWAYIHTRRAHPQRDNGGPQCGAQTW